MDRIEFLNNYDKASDVLDKKWIRSVINRADDIGVKINGEHIIRGHENLIIDMEEMAELTQQISKHLRGKGDYYSLLEEMADVQVCLYHLQTLFNIKEEELNRAVNVKLQRCERRLNEIEEKL